MPYVLLCTLYTQIVGPIRMHPWLLTTHLGSQHHVRLADQLHLQSHKIYMGNYASGGEPTGQSTSCAPIT